MTDTIHPEFAAHGSFEHLKLGRAPKRDDARTLQLARYLDDAVVLPAVPPEYDLAHLVASYPMYGNDSKGDCTCAAVGHMIQTWTAAAGKASTPPDAAIEALYIPETGAADEGRVEIDVLNYWRQTGVDGGDKIVGYAAVHPANLDHVRAAIYLFGGLYTGVCLPRTAQGQSEWAVVGDPTDENGPAYPCSWGGHAVPLIGYDATSFGLVTWGGVLRATDDWWTTYADEAYAVISQDWIDAQGATPNGLDLEQLQADIGALTGNS